MARKRKPSSKQRGARRPEQSTGEEASREKASREKASRDEVGPASRPPRKRLLFFRILRWGLGVPLLLITIALIALHTPPVQNKLRSAAVERLQQRFQGEVSLQDLSFTLLGDVSLDKLTITDPQGDEVVAVDKLLVTPDWRAWLGGEPVLQLAAVQGVRVHVVQYEDGTTNLKRLLKPRPKKPPQPKKPLRRTRIVVRDLDIGPIDVVYDKADGTRVALDQLKLDGTLDVVPADRTARISLPTITAGLRLNKDKQGLALSLSDFQTGLELELKDGAGTLSIQRTRAKAGLVREGNKRNELDLDLAGVTLAIEPGKLGATLDKLLAGVVLLEVLELQRSTDGEGKLAGEQKASVVGLKLNAKRLNELLHREVLRSDIGMETSITGPANKLAMVLKIDSQGGLVDVSGELDASRQGRPGFDVKLHAGKLNTSALLVEGVAPDVLLESLDITATSADDDSITATLRARQLQVLNKYGIDTVALDATVKDKRIHIDPLTLEAYGHKAIARGDIDLKERTIDITLTVDGDIGATLEKLRAAGIAIKTRLPAGKITLREGAITVRIHGDIDGLLYAEIKANDFRIAGGSIEADVQARLRRNPQPKEGDKKVALEALDGTVELRHVSVNQLLALRGKTFKDMSARVSGQLRLSEVPAEPHIGYRLVLQSQPHGMDRMLSDQPMLQAVLHGGADRHNAKLAITLDGKQKDTQEQLLTGQVQIPLFISDEHKGIDPFRKLSAKIDMPRRAWRELIPYLPKRVLIDKATGKPRKIPADAAVEAHVDIAGTAIEPGGTVQVDAFVPALGSAMQRLKLDGRLSSNAPPLAAGTPALSFSSDITAWLDARPKPKPNAAAQPLKPAITGTAKLDLARSPLLGGGGKRSWSLDLTVAPQKLQALPLAAVARAGLRGAADGRVIISGDSEGAFNGDIKLNGRKLFRKGMGPIDAKVALSLNEQPTQLSIDLDLAGRKLADIDGRVDLAGADILDLISNRPLSGFALLRLAATDMNLTVALPDNPIAALAPLKAELGALPGMVGGKIEVRGALGKPKLDGLIRYDRFTTVAGTPGRVALVLDGDRSDMAARLELGPSSGGRAPVTVKLGAPNVKIFEYVKASRCYGAAAKRAFDEETAKEDGAAPCKDGVRLPVSASARAEKVDLRTLVPAFVVAGQSFEARGDLNWRLDGTVQLDPKPRYAERDGQTVKLPPVSPDSKLSGKLGIDNGLVSIPGTKRRYRDIRLQLEHDLKKVRLSALKLRESDREKKNRSIDIDGSVTLDNFRPDQLSLNLSARDWLVFGTDKLGKPDAPRGALTLSAKASGRLARSIKQVNVEVSQLELLIPKRFRRAHQPETVSLGDVVFLEGNAKPGKLPVPASKRKDKLQPTPAPVEGDGAKANTGLDLRVAIPKPVHILQHPMNLYASGSVDVKVRGKQRSVNGKLTMSKGDLSLGGRKHPLQRGTVIFDKEHPGGQMDLLFGRREHNATLRNLSQASGGELVTLHLQGPLNARRTTLSGAGSPGTLFDLLSVHNAGRERYTSQPDMPATMTVQYPQHLNLLLLSYLSVNAPHLLFLDRVSAWSDAYDLRATSGYGRVQNYESEGYSTDGKLRFRGVLRPRTPGRSSAEAQLDYLFDNTPQTAVGVGVGVGSRLGGGPGVFVEWSSKD